MMSRTGRWALPLLDAGQAQKEMTHNEALATVDLLLQAAVLAVGVDAPPVDPVAGQCWIVGAAPTGDWAAHPRALAGWTDGGWRFVAPREGQGAWSVADGCLATFTGGQWRLARMAAIPPASGGATVDAEARAVLDQVLAALIALGMIGG